MKNNETSSMVDDGEKLPDPERQPCEVWTRVMGYHRPVSSFNVGKKGEVAERIYFREPDGGQTNEN